MINIPNNPVTPVTPQTKQTEPTQPAKPNKPVGDGESQKKVPARPFVERRKNNDRRQNRRSNRGLYDMRSGKDRRKNNPGKPSIEVDV